MKQILILKINKYKAIFISASDHLFFVTKGKLNFQTTFLAAPEYISLQRNLIREVDRFTGAMKFDSEL